MIDKIFEAALSRGGHYAELYAEQTAQQGLELADGVVSQATHTLVRGIGIRVLNGEHTGYAYVMTPELPELLRAARSAAQIADGGSGVAAIHPEVRQSPAYRDSAFSFFPSMADPAALPADVLTRLESMTYAHDPRVVKVTAALSSTTTDVTLLSTQLLPLQDHRTRTVLMLRVVLEQDGKREMGFASEQLQMEVLSFITEERLRSLVQRAVEQAQHLFEATTPQGGDMPVVMAAGASGILLHEAIGHAFEADFNRLGTSIFSDKMGQQICRAGITIVDDATLPLSTGSYAVDDEGTPSQCTHLVHDGRLESYLHDRISATHFGVKPTGNGRRQSFRCIPVPRMTNTYMWPGEASEEDIIRSVKRGIYAQSFTNGQVQIGAGDFTFFLKTGFLIEDGRLTTPIRDVNIIGNGPRALADISLVGNNLAMDLSAAYCGKAGQRVPVGQGLPTVRVDNLTVGGV